MTLLAVERIKLFSTRSPWWCIGLAAVIMIEIVQVARGVLIWIVIAAFLAAALNPAVVWLQQHGIRRRGPGWPARILLSSRRFSSMRNNQRR